MTRVLLCAFAFPIFALAAAAQPADVKPAASKIVAVTVYQNTAMITREVTVPEAVGLTEVIVSPLPPATMQSSLYSEGADGVRILSTRYRTRAIAEDNREEVRKLEAKIKDAQKKLQAAQADLTVMVMNAAFLTKLENFTAATLVTLTEKGHLDSEKTIALATHIRETRVKTGKEEVTLKQQIEAIQEEIAFTQRLLQEKAGGVSRTERDAVIVIDKTKPGSTTVRLNYLVSNAAWRPQYKLKAGAKDADKVNVEYLAAMTQQTGEDWANVALTLSTAAPLLNAAPPDLLALEVSVTPGGQLAGTRGGQPVPGAPGGGPGGQGGFGMPNSSAYLKDLDKQSQDLRGRSQSRLNNKEEAAGGKDANDAAALEQYRDLVVSREDVRRGDQAFDGIAGGPSVTYRLKDKISLPSRNDDQVLEITKLELTPKFYYKAVPILSPHVYKLADLTNATEYILLPGEATMYIGSDFVGQTRIPLVAIGKPFTVGFGADPQLQVQRKLIDKTQTTQGGNQVLTFKYRVLLSSYKTNTVDVQVWDRMPHAEAMQTIAVSMVKADTELSKDTLYLRDERPKNLLRWDVKLEPKHNGEKALAIEYEYKIEFDRNVNIGAFLAK